MIELTMISKYLKTNWTELENLISNKMSHQKYESDINYRFLIDGIIYHKNNSILSIDSDYKIYIIFIRLEPVMVHFI